MQKRIFRGMMAGMVGLYRRTGGSFGGKVGGLSVLLLTTSGRKTGKKYTTPLGFFEDQGAFVICASNAGADQHPGWFRNLQHDPHVEIEIKKQHLTARAEVASGAERQRLWDRLTALAPNYLNYVKKTTREIPMIILHPERS
ncbi:MAG TPA: nitroreductase family deazaflavin-dependent oxidoreductase [Aggregatilineales bacterium]|nr:nitroreductase family deazaflavin-dependent oxidoreductase [Aggregatilineales bacterium]